MGGLLDARSAGHIGEIARTLAIGESSLDDALGLILSATCSERVSIATIDDDRSTFEIREACGDWLLAPGSRFPLSTSTHFSVAAQGTSFVSANLSRDRRFRRPVDRIVREYGFDAGVCLPLRHERGAPGALALHWHESSAPVDEAAELLEPILGGLACMLTSPRDKVELKVLVCHDDPLVRRGIASLLEEDGAVAIQSATRRAALAAMSEPAPALVVADVAFEGIRVDGWIAELRRAGVGAPLLVVATHDTTDNLAAARAAGAVGYVSRRDVESSLRAAAGAIVAGRTWLPPQAPRSPSQLLTPRELEVLQHLDHGLRLAQIAAELTISHATVKAHVRNLFRKLGASSRAEATHEARHQGLLPA
jgi:DNA-binding NarL/FixJ family response regulator